MVIAAKTEMTCGVLLRKSARAPAGVMDADAWSDKSTDNNVVCDMAPLEGWCGVTPSWRHDNHDAQGDRENKEDLLGLADNG